MTYTYPPSFDVWLRDQYLLREHTRDPRCVRRRRAGRRSVRPHRLGHDGRRRDGRSVAPCSTPSASATSRGVHPLRENPTMTLIRRPLIAPAYSGAAPAPAPRADGILFLRASRPATETETPDNAATEAAPAATCSACEGLAEAPARIEDKLTSLLPPGRHPRPGRRGGPRLASVDELLKTKAD